MYYAQLRAFHAVATYGGFSKAADQLRLTQPAISDQVKKLEEIFEVRLFNRSRRAVEPTELGKRLLQITRRQFAMEAEALELLRESQALRTGHLSIIADAPLHATKMVADFRQLYPGITVSLTMGNSNKVMDALFSYRSDIGVLAIEPDDERLLVRALRDDPIVAFVPREHAWAGRKTVTMKEIAEEPLILREIGSETRRLVEDEFGKIGKPPKIALETEGREAVREAVAAGIGISIVSFPEFGHDSRLVPLEIEDCQRRMMEFIACLNERSNLGATKAFLDMLN